MWLQWDPPRHRDRATETGHRGCRSKRRVWTTRVDEGAARAFYGPKIDIKIKDALGRSWQCSTIQLDFNLPERFGMTFIDSENREVQPHHDPSGPAWLAGALLRRHGGALRGGPFPVWLAPEQVRIIPIADRHFEYAEKIRDAYRARGLRVEVDLSSNRNEQEDPPRPSSRRCLTCSSWATPRWKPERRPLRLRDGRQIDPMATDAIADEIRKIDEKKENYELWALKRSSDRFKVSSLFLPSESPAPHRAGGFLRYPSLCSTMAVRRGNERSASSETGAARESEGGPSLRRELHVEGGGPSLRRELHAEGGGPSLRRELHAEGGGPSLRRELHAEGGGPSLRRELHAEGGGAVSCRRELHAEGGEAVLCAGSFTRKEGESPRLRRVVLFQSLPQAHAHGR